MSFLVFSYFDRGVTYTKSIPAGKYPLTIKEYKEKVRRYVEFQSQGYGVILAIQLPDGSVI